MICLQDKARGGGGEVPIKGTLSTRFPLDRMAVTKMTPNVG